MKSKRKKDILNVVRDDEASLKEFEYFDNKDFSSEIEEARKDNSFLQIHGNPNDTIDKSLERIRKAIEESKAEKKMYSFRLKVRTVDALKARAAAIGVPYQTYVNTLLDKEAFGTV